MTQNAGAPAPADTRPDWVKAIPHAREVAASRDEWVRNRVNERAPRRFTVGDRAHLKAAAEREWAKRHPAIVARLGMAS